MSDGVVGMGADKIIMVAKTVVLSCDIVIHLQQDLYFVFSVCWVNYCISYNHHLHNSLSLSPSPSLFPSPFPSPYLPPSPSPFLSLLSQTIFKRVVEEKNCSGGGRISGHITCGSTGSNMPFSIAHTGNAGLCTCACLG